MEKSSHHPTAPAGAMVQSLKQAVCQGWEFSATAVQGSQSQPKAGRQIQSQEQVRTEVAEAGVIVQCSMGNLGTAVLA